MAITFMKGKGAGKAEVSHPEDVIKRLLHSKIAGYSKSRFSKDVVHASDLTKDDFCARRIALYDRHNKRPPDEFIGTSLRLTFAYGMFLEELLTNEYMAGFLFGDWLCLACKSKQCNTTKPVYPCQSCGAQKWKYKEARFFDPLSRVSSGIDALVKTPEYDKFLVLELKTMNAADFKKLKAPLHEHELRTNIYLHVINKSTESFKDSINTEVGRVLYVCKGFGVQDTSIGAAGIKDTSFSPFKEFKVERTSNPEVEAKFAHAREFKRYHDQGVMPVRSVCDKSTCDIALRCPVRKECFDV